MDYLLYVVMIMSSSSIQLPAEDLPGTTKLYSHELATGQSPLLLAAADQEDGKLKTSSAADSLPQVAVGQLVRIPGGTFQMGDVTGNGRDNEKPVHSVNIKPFLMGTTEVTFTQWDACVEAGGCSHSPGDNGWGRGNQPVINISYDDITQQFIPWLNKTTSKHFRLPTEAEWEYAARAGKTTDYSWGDDLGTNRANCRECGSRWEKRAAPVASFSANPFGLYDMHGNLWEWVEDCWTDNYADAPTDGSAQQHSGCEDRVMRGGSWYDSASFVRAGIRIKFSGAGRAGNKGFRLVREL